VLADAAQATKILFLYRIDRVLLPLPLKSREYLGTAVSALRREGIVQYYDFIRVDKGESPTERMSAIMRPLAHQYGLILGKARIVKSVAPRRYLVSLELGKSNPYRG
jgi:tRNA G37 N-methylase Trm5